MKSSRTFLPALLALCVGAACDAVADFHPGPMLIGRIAAKKLKEMRQQDDFGGADANKDGKLDKHEATKAKETHGLEIDDETFKKIDKNGDGLLSHEECEQYHKACEEAAAKEKETATEKESVDKRKDSGKSATTEKPKRLRPLQRLFNPSQD